jgi:hypothetical protein
VCSSFDILGANHCASELDLGAGPVRFWDTCLRDMYRRGGTWEAAFCDGGGGPAHGAGLVCCSSENVWFSMRSKWGDWRKSMRPVSYHVSSSSSSCHRWVRHMSASPRQF